MMDKKYRGQCVDSDKWVYGYFYREFPPIQCIVIDKDESRKVETLDHFILFPGFADWNMPRPVMRAKVKPETVGEFIGVRDKNGNEIYEGMKVKAWSQGCCAEFTVTWRQEATPCWILYPAYQNGDIWHIKASKEPDGLYYDRGIEILSEVAK
ncbi:MAG: hypothetical protein E6713_02880 [Sporomusaceae bacterium]|nr:hypothetical protein [Sporomusaceae bacterium]